MLTSKFLIAILVTIVSKNIYKPCESVKNLYSLSEGRPSFLQANVDDKDTPETVTSGETVDVASNKTGTEAGKEATAGESKTEEQGEPKEPKEGEKSEKTEGSEGTKEEQTPEPKKESKAEAEEENETHPSPKEKEGLQHPETPEQGGKQEQPAHEKGEGHSHGPEEGKGHPHHPAPVHGGKHEEPDFYDEEEDDYHHFKSPLGEALEESQGHGGHHQSHHVEDHHGHRLENHQTVSQGESHADHTETHHHHADNANGHSSTPEVHPHPTQPQTNPTEEHEHVHEQTHNTDQQPQEQEVKETEHEPTEHSEKQEDKPHEAQWDKEQAHPNGQSYPKASDTEEVPVEPHKEAEKEGDPQTEEDTQGASKEAETPKTEQATEPEAYKVDLNKLTEEQKKAVESFYSKPDGQCSVDCEHSCKSALGGKTQCVSTTETSVSCSTFADSKNLTCPQNYTPCVQPVVTTLRSFTVKNGNEEVGQLEVDGSNFNGCMGLALAPNDGNCDKTKLLHNLLYTSGALNLDYVTEVSSDKITFSNLKMKNGEFKVCLFQRYVGDDTKGTLSNLFARLLEYVNLTKEAHHENRAVFSMEVGSLKVTD